MCAPQHIIRRNKPRKAYFLMVLLSRKHITWLELQAVAGFTAAAIHPQNRKAKGQQMKVSDPQWKGSKAEMSKEQCIVFIFCV